MVIIAKTVYRVFDNSTNMQLCFQITLVPTSVANMTESVKPLWTVPLLPRVIVPAQVIPVRSVVSICSSSFDFSALPI